MHSTPKKQKIHITNDQDVKKQSTDILNILQKAEEQKKQRGIGGLQPIIMGKKVLPKIGQGLQPTANQDSGKKIPIKATHMP